MEITVIYNNILEAMGHTPLIRLGRMPEKGSAQILVKFEGLNVGGSIKTRTAYNMIRDAEGKGLIHKDTIIVEPTSGNQGIGLALVGAVRGYQTKIIMPDSVSEERRKLVCHYGAEVILEGDVFDEACAYAYKLAEENGYTFVHPFDDLTVATGQGTISMEIIKELPTVDYILVPIGGGGLCTGVSVLAKLLNPKIKVIGVEPAGAACMKASLKAGEVVSLPSVNTIADGTAVKRPGEKLFPYIQENVDDIITVEDSELIVAFLDMVENHKMIVENSGLLTVAALKHMNVEKKKIVSILSGGNMDVITMASVIQHGLIQRDRVFTVSVLLPDKPGELAAVSTLLAKEQGNVIKLEHNQFISINRNAAVELRITMEAFGTEHKNAIVAALNEAGYRPKLVKSKGIYSE